MQGQISVSALGEHRGSHLQREAVDQRGGFTERAGAARPSLVLLGGLITEIGSGAAGVLPALADLPA